MMHNQVVGFLMLWLIFEQVAQTTLSIFNQKIILSYDIAPWSDLMPCTVLKLINHLWFTDFGNNMKFSRIHLAKF